MTRYETQSEAVHMTTRIEKDGWVVTGDTREDLELGIEAVQRVLSRHSHQETSFFSTATPKVSAAISHAAVSKWVFKRDSHMIHGEKRLCCS